MDSKALTPLEIQLMSIVVHLEEHIDTGEPLDLAAANSVRELFEVKNAFDDADKLALLPVKR